MLTRASSVFIHHHIFSLNHLLSIIAMWRLALLDNKELVEVYSSLYVMLFWIKDRGGDMDMLKGFLWYNQRYDRFDYKFFELKRKWCRRCENLLTISKNSNVVNKIKSKLWHEKHIDICLLKMIRFMMTTKTRIVLICCCIAPAFSPTNCLPMMCLD